MISAEVALPSLSITGEHGQQIGASCRCLYVPELLACFRVLHYMYSL